MPFEEHSEFILPDDRSAVIWRYMDISKFLSLLDKKALFFVRVDKLVKYDAFEGYYTPYNQYLDALACDSLAREFGEIRRSQNETILGSMKDEMQRLREFVRCSRTSTFVNSWHAQPHESAAMWRLYTKSDEGIAIKSTIQRLIDSLSGYSDYDIYISMLKYIDYSKEAIPEGNLLSPFIHKRKSFEHERELRALIWTPQDGKNLPYGGYNKHSLDDGLYVSVDTNILVECIQLAPHMPKWIHEALESVMKRFDLERPIVQSDLSACPLN